MSDAIADVERIRALLIDAARGGEALSYSHVLAMLGHRFTRPKMRALCKTLDRIDQIGRDAGQPELAVLVVRESDGLPGQGWWIGRPDASDLVDWTGPAARAFVRERQDAAFDHWRR